jgi:hypothetical protein
MKAFVIRTGKIIFIPLCALMIAYCIFYQYIINFPYLFIVKITLLILFVFQFIGWIIDLFSNSKRNRDKPILTNNRIIRILYMKSYSIIIQSFCYYFAVYLIFMLDKKSILYNYLVLFLFGLLLGYKIALKSCNYLKANQEWNKKKTGIKILDFKRDNFN